jgi:sec-independent protein translocase protein TatA
MAIIPAWLYAGASYLPRMSRKGVDWTVMGLDNPLHIAFLLIVVLLVFGAKRLPEIGRAVGTGMREFKDSISGQTPMLSQSAAQPQAPTQPVAPQPFVAQAPAPQPAAAQAPVAAPAAPAAAQAPAEAPAEPVQQARAPS